MTPLIKKQTLNKNELGNYRPVSNLPFLSKVTERIVAAQLERHLQMNHLHDPQQSAHRAHHSCETAMAFLQSQVIAAMDNGSVTFLVLLDLSAAFDTINHSVLLRRLRQQGDTDKAHKWLEKYLKDRSQSVRIEGADSEAVRLRTGVPQGSVLGPHLFNIYIQDLSRVITNHPDVSYLLYADDLQVWISARPNDAEDAMDNLEACRQSIREGYSMNHWTLNDTQSEFITFGT